MAAMAAGERRDLRVLFEPRSVAVVGASNDPAKWGQWLARSALLGAHRRSVFLINRSGGTVLGHQAYRSLEELLEEPELVVLAIPASAFEETVEASLAAGAKAIVAITAGLGESSADGSRREQAVVERVRAAGAVLVGPNCMGLYDGPAELDLASSDFVPGSLGLISQSGNLAIEVSLLGKEVGLGISRFVSIGNQADLEAAELVEELAAHEPTRVIAVYLEDFRDGRRFARAAAAAGKPVVLLAGGTSEVGIRAARSHTGALVSESAAIAAACRAAGIVQVSSPRELVEVAQVLLAPDPPRGRRVAIVTDGGGSAVVAADLASAAGLQLPPLSEGLEERLSAVMPPTAATSNPVDFAGAGEQDLSSYERVPRLLLESGEVDSVLLTGYLGGYSATSEELREPETEAARGLARAARETGRAVLVQTMYWQEAPALALRAADVPVFRDTGSAIAALSLVAARPEATGVPQLPAPAEPWSGSGYLEARTFLAEAGLSFPRSLAAGSPDEALAAASELGYPVVLKALGVLHKSDAGGVALGLETPEELARAAAAMEAPEGYSVERMVAAPGAVELIAGCRWDRRLGPVLLLGLGGIFAEVLRDTAVALAPADTATVELLLLDLRGASMMTGARGRPPLAVRAAAEAAAALSVLAAQHPELDEIEINPLLVTADDAIALDARVVHSQPR
jgi:acyl-CoA synthetase (NDP forming)